MPDLELGALTLLLFQIAAILVVSRALGVVTGWMGQPLVIAEVIAGILLGPSLLGWLWPEGMAWLFPASSLSSLKMLSQLGLLLFMFLIGLELNPKLLRGRAHTSVFISHASIVLPFVLGVGSAYLLHEDYNPPGVSFWSFALFLGVAMSVTAFPVLARILSERHLLDSRVGAITIACAAVDDVTAWCLLAFVVAIARAHGVTDAIWTTGLALVFIVVMLYVVRPFLSRLSAGRRGLNQSVVAGVLLMLVISSSISELIGIHALFGAFLFGAILPKDNGLAESLAEKVDTIAVVLLLPLFFAFSGLRTQIGLVSQPQEWLVAGFLILIATIGKFGGSTLAARLTGLRWREASAIGILMNTRGLMELIVLNIGLDLGVISPTVFTMLVLMALVTTFGTTPILRWVYPDHELARDRLVEPADFRAGGQPPFTLVLGVSSGTAARGLIEVASALLGKRDQASRLFAVHLRPPAERLSTDLRDQESEAVVAPLLQVVEYGRERMIDVRPLSFVSTEPATDLCRTAESKQAAMVLLGSHKPLLLEGGFSGTVGDVLAHSSSPVGVLLERGLTKVERILFAYPTGAQDPAVLQVVALLARYPGASVTCLGVMPPGGRQNETHARRALQSALADREIMPVRTLFVEDASPPSALVAEAANGGYELVVIGSNECWALHPGLLSSREERSLAECPVSILVVHPGSMKDSAQTAVSEGYRAPFDGPAAVGASV
jgi:Kef-type K+ transport system membrane component KefB/nucleotide-binding universal stress UspA family protein